MINTDKMKKEEANGDEPKKEILHIADIKCNAIWKTDTQKYSNGRSLYIGKIKVTGYHYDEMRSRNDPKAYKVTSPIGTIKSDLGNFETEEECKAICLEVARVFCKQLEYCP